MVGGGPQLETLRRNYPDVRFVGPQEGEELARYYSAADVFVFPSRTDTFGNVVLEALASGVPVAAETEGDREGERLGLTVASLMSADSVDPTRTVRQ